MTGHHLVILIALDCREEVLMELMLEGGVSGYMGGVADGSLGGPGTSGFGNAVYGMSYDSALGDFRSGSTPDRIRGS